MAPKIFFSFTLYLCLVSSIAGQTPETLLEQFREKHPIEKMYLHLDRENYLAGDTIWWKAYLLSDYLPDTISSTVYTELVAEDGSIISRHVFPVLAGSAYGQLEIPDTISSGNYLLRAYTSVMEQLWPDFLFQKPVYVYGKNIKKSEPAGSDSINLQFFPEGGSLATAVSNTIAFKITDAYGLPLSLIGQILDDQNNRIAELVCFHDGMGSFEMIPRDGRRYIAALEYLGRKLEFELPEHSPNAVSITILPHPQGNFFEIRQPSANSMFRVAYLLGQMQHRVVFRQDVLEDRNEFQGIINTKNLHSGILHLTAFNKDGVPLAERLVFVNNKEFLQPAELRSDSISFAARALNKLSLYFPDTLQGSLSVSITDAEKDIYPHRQENILSSLLLSADVRGYVQHPSWYFAAGNDSASNALDLLLMTQGWRRFRWEKLHPDSIGISRFKNPGFITVNGKITLRGVKKPFADKDLVLFVSPQGAVRFSTFIHTDSSGNFRVDSLLFFGKSRLLFSDIRGKKSNYIDVYLSADSVNRLFQLKTPQHDYFKTNYKPGDNYLKSAAYDYEAIQKASGIMLEEIRLKSVRKSPLQQVDERYTTGLFSGDAIKSVDLVNSDEANPYMNIFEYLQSRVNGLQVVNDGPEYGVFYRQGPSVSSMGNMPMSLFLDEVETDPSVIASIPANQIALVKVYSSFAGAWGNAPGGVLALYTKKGKDYVNTTGRAGNISYEGYTLIREFYRPAYTSEVIPASEDNRITLEWMPHIFVHDFQPVIPVRFYNNDRTRKFKIVVEGMTSSGKLICIEKIITP